MSRNNQLPSNLPQLQNLTKRDPDAYKEEVCTCILYVTFWCDHFGAALFRAALFGTIHFVAGPF